MAEGRFVYNHDIAGLYRRINRFLVELAHSQSNGVSQVIAHDQARLQTYLDALKTFKAWVMAQPLLDLPETHPTQYMLEPDPNLPEVENESVADVMRLFLLMREELLSSQSARLSSNLTPHDDVRLSSIIDKAQNFLTNYIQVTTPLDLPESSPDESIAPAGKIGV